MSVSSLFYKNILNKIVKDDFQIRKNTEIAFDLFLNIKLYLQRYDFKSLKESSFSPKNMKNTFLNREINIKISEIKVRETKNNALIVFLGVRLHEGTLNNFNFFKVNLQMFQRNRKVKLTYCLGTNFHNISNISLRVISRKNYS